LEEIGLQISDELYKLLYNKTLGNPFFVQQILQYFLENNLLIKEDKDSVSHWSLTISRYEKLPDTINAILIARIDRLSQQVKDVVKVASVIGKEFEVRLLSAILRKDIIAQVKVAEEVQIWGELKDLDYIFKHALLRDVAYDMQLRARLRELHKLTAVAIEELYKESIEQKYADLAFHYEKSETIDRATEYLEKAGDYAKKNHQNMQAIDFYDRLEKYITDKKYKIKITNKKANVLELIGKWDIAEEIYRNNIKLSEELHNSRLTADNNINLAGILQKKSNYNEAFALFESIYKTYMELGDKVGISKAIGGMGGIYYDQGNYDSAMECYQKKLSISEEVNDKIGISKAIGNMGNIYYRTLQ
jgi:predicted ATPase